MQAVRGAVQTCLDRLDRFKQARQHHKGMLDETVHLLRGDLGEEEIEGKVAGHRQREAQILGMHSLLGREGEGEEEETEMVERIQEVTGLAVG